MAGLGMGGLAPYTAATSATGGTAPTAAASTACGGGIALGGAALLSYGAGGATGTSGHKHHGHQHPPHHYRHSLTNRHRVLRTRSSGATHNIWDDQVLEVSSRRINMFDCHRVLACVAANESQGMVELRRNIFMNENQQHTKQ